MRNTAIRDTTLVDVILVCNDLPEDEIEQIEAFSGETFDAQQMAIRVMTSPGSCWTCYDKETGTPLVVAGFIPVGVTVWRSFMLASNYAWEKHGVEVTLQCRKAIRDLIRGQQHIRLETMCLANRYKARAWYPRIGLGYESTLVAYGAHGETAVLYTKTQGSKDF